MLFKNFPFPLNNLPSKSKISNLEYSIINKNITGLNISVHKVKLIQFSKSIEYLGKVVPDNNFSINHSLFFDFVEKKHKILLIAEFEHNVDDIFIPNDVLDSDYVLVLAQFYQGQDLLPRCRYDVLDCLYLLVCLWNCYYF